MKPSGINFSIGSDGPKMRVTGSSRVEDKIWEAVQEAVVSNWSVEMFKEEAADAFQHEYRELEADVTRQMK